MESCVLFQSDDKSVVVIDIPRSIEQAQVLPDSVPRRRLVSSRAPETPWQQPAPSTNKARGGDAAQPPPAVALDELMTLDAVHRACAELKRAHAGPWCWPRVVHDNDPGQATQTQVVVVAASPGRARKRKQDEPEIPATDERGEQEAALSPFVPIDSRYLQGNIAALREEFLNTAPTFDLVVLDPPWPSRSVRRKGGGYTIARGMAEAEELLLSIPIAARLEPDGLVAIWVTNKPAVMELVRSPGGLFARWGLEAVGDWIWLKVTASGEPIVDPESRWRKPWERLLIARKRGSSAKLGVERKVLVGVPDLHSRKPNLRHCFDDELPRGFRGLEVFARNLTAGWWSWGDEALLFQQPNHWAEPEVTTEKPST